MTNTKSYTGGCHCGRVRYEVAGDADLNHVITCNCSMCGKKGHMLAFVGEQQFKLLSGEDSLTDYQFNKHVVHHLFCNRCGVSSFAWGTGADGKKAYSINVRCVDGIDPKSLTVQEVDGRSL